MRYALAVLATFREMNVRQKIMHVVTVVLGALAAYRVIEDWDGEGRGRFLEGLAAAAIILAVVGVNDLVLTIRKRRKEDHSVR
jgi:hypothetical protein